MMSSNRIRRLPVVKPGSGVVGMVALGDLATHLSPEQAGRALAAISTYGGPHGEGGGAKPKATSA